MKYSYVVTVSILGTFFRNAEPIDTALRLKLFKKSSVCMPIKLINSEAPLQPTTSSECGFLCSSMAQCVLFRYIKQENICTVGVVGANDIETKCFEDFMVINYQTCMNGDIHCKDEIQCISAELKCDKNPDCADGSDEEECDYQTCDSDEFMCLDGSMCIPYTRRCDDYNNCQDLSDELDCDGCFECLNGLCIPDAWHCDNHNNCGDWYDEMVDCCFDFVTLECIWGKADCFQCGNKMCIPTAWLCDNFTNCWDNSDEINC